MLKTNKGTGNSKPTNVTLILSFHGYSIVQCDVMMVCERASSHTRTEAFLRSIHSFIQTLKQKMDSQIHHADDGVHWVTFTLTFS